MKEEGVGKTNIKPPNLQSATTCSTSHKIFIQPPNLQSVTPSSISHTIFISQQILYQPPNLHQPHHLHQPPNLHQPPHVQPATKSLINNQIYNQSHHLQSATTCSTSHTIFISHQILYQPPDLHQPPHVQPATTSSSATTS